MEAMDRNRRLSTREVMDMLLLTTRIQDAVQLFSEGGWVDGREYPARFPELVRMMSASEDRYHSASIGGVEVRAGTTAGRALVTFQKEDSQITVIGADDEPERGCGLQSIDASAKDAVDMIDRVVKGWDVSRFRPNPRIAIA